MEPTDIMIVYYDSTLTALYDPVKDLFLVGPDSPLFRQRYIKKIYQAKRLGPTHSYNDKKFYDLNTLSRFVMRSVMRYFIKLHSETLGFLYIKSEHTDVGDCVC